MCPKLSGLLSPSVWKGELLAWHAEEEEKTVCYIQWLVLPQNDKGEVACEQKIYFPKQDRSQVSLFVFSQINSWGFSLQVKNPLHGQIIGTGLQKEDVLGWELEDTHGHYSSIEIYENLSPTLYLLQGDYQEDFDGNSSMYGRLWRYR